MVPLRIVLRRSELGVMIEMPPRELARRDPARHGVEPREHPLQARALALEDGVMDDLMQENGEVEHGKTLQEGERRPDEHVGGGDEAPARQRKDAELACRNRKVTPGALPVK